jgi:hypothetical protein
MWVHGGKNTGEEARKKEVTEPQKHSPEPWIVEVPDCAILSANGDVIIEDEEGARREDMERIIVCVNAMKDVPTEVLKRKLFQMVYAKDPDEPDDEWMATWTRIAKNFLRELGFTISDPAPVGSIKGVDETAPCN